MTQEKDELFSLYGDIGNKKVQPLRAFCRDRLRGIDDFFIRHALEKSATESEHIAAKIDLYNGNEGAISEAQFNAMVMEYWADRPADLRQIIKGMYKRNYSDQEDETSTSQYTQEQKCPYEENPDKRSCWGCNVPVKVWDVMERQYRKEEWEGTIQEHRNG